MTKPGEPTAATPGYITYDPPTEAQKAKIDAAQKSDPITGPRIVAEGSIAKLGSIAPEEREERHRVAVKIIELDANVTYCTAAGVDWLEVDKDLLMHLNGGDMPDCGYFIYKNVKICLEGQAETVAARDKLTIHEVLFKDEGYMKIR